MSETSEMMTPGRPTPVRTLLHPIVALACSALLSATTIAAGAQQTPAPPPASAPAPAAEKPLPGLDLSSIDMGADPCTDMYKFACGKFSANHPIPADQSGV